jgi:hypothetical protein
MSMVVAELKYLAPTSGKPIYRASTGGAAAKLDMQGEFAVHRVGIQNMRPDAASLSLDCEGFVLIAHETAVSDFYDDPQIKRIYEKEISLVLTELTGARRIVVFDHTLRSDDPEIRQKHDTREPAAVVHNDYTDQSARKRLGEILPDEYEMLAKHRFAIVNVWRPVRNSVFRTPLTLCHAGTISTEDLVPTERRARDRVGELTLVKFNPDHRWCYFPRMQLNEALVFKTFDSSTDGRARFSIHTSFADPDAPPGSPPRQSMETRAFALFS